MDCTELDICIQYIARLLSDKDTTVYTLLISILIFVIIISFLLLFIKTCLIISFRAHRGGLKWHAPGGVRAVDDLINEEDDSLDVQPLVL